MRFCTWCQLESESDDKCVWCKRPFVSNASPSGPGRNDLYYLNNGEDTVDRTPLVFGIAAVLFFSFLLFAFLSYGNKAPQKEVALNEASQDFSGTRGSGVRDVYADRFQGSPPPPAIPPITSGTYTQPPPQAPPKMSISQQTPSGPGPGLSYSTGTNSSPDLKPYVVSGGYIETASVSLVKGEDGNNCYGNATIINSDREFLKFRIWLDIDGSRHELFAFSGTRAKPELRGIELPVGGSQNVQVIARGLPVTNEIKRMTMILESYNADNKLVGSDHLVIKTEKN